MIKTLKILFFLMIGLVLTMSDAMSFERRAGQKYLVISSRQKVPIMDPSIKYDASIRTLQQAMYDALVK